MPVSVDLVSSEHLLSELLIPSALESIDFHSVRVAVHIMILSEHVRDGIEGGKDSEDSSENNLLVGNFRSSQVHQVLRNIVSHLRSGRRNSVFVLYDSVMKLWGHTDNHVVKVRVEVFSFGYIKSKRWVVVESSHDVINEVDQSWVH